MQPKRQTCKQVTNRPVKAARRAMEQGTARLLLFSAFLTSVAGECRFEHSASYTSLHPFSRSKYDGEFDRSFSRYNATALYPLGQSIFKSSKVRSIITTQLNSTLDSGPAPQIRSVCFNDSVSVCWCTPTELDCSGNNGTLTFVPKVKGTFKFLNFTYNHLERIGADFFRNVTHIVGIDLGDNHYLHYIHPSAFHPVRSLQQLFLDYDYALTESYSLLDPVFSVSTLIRLDIRVGNLPPLPQDLFRRHRLPVLDTLYLHYNDLQHINMTTLKPLRSLKVLGAASNRIAYIHADFAPLLEKLNLRYNAIGKSFPRTCYYWKSFYPSLKQLFLMGNKIERLTKRVCLPSLEYLDLSGNAIKVISSHMFGAKFFPRLNELYLQFMDRYMKGIEPRAFANPSLKTVSLLYNSLYFSTQHVSNDSFSGCENLKHLLLGHNHVVSNEQFIQIFGHLRSLTYLHVGSCAMRDVSRETFSQLTNLTTLCAYQNQLTSLPPGAFDSLKRLSILELNDNQIETISPGALPPVGGSGHQGLVQLDLSDNPFRCGCDLLWFRDWFRSNAALFRHSWGSYQCRNRLNTTLEGFTMVQQACLLSREVILVLITIVVLFLMGLLASAIFYRFRWNIRLRCQECCRGSAKSWRRCESDERSFDYDVFLCYAHEDIEWVTSYLLPELEQRMGLRLCLHQRDFLAGRMIVDNIFNGILRSRRILVLFSRSFTRSQWCQFELSLCLHHVIDVDEAVVVVCVDGLEARGLTRTMMAVLATTTCLFWRRRHGNTAFWARLALALSQPTPPSILPPGLD